MKSKRMMIALMLGCIMVAPLAEINTFAQIKPNGEFGGGIEQEINNKGLLKASSSIASYSVASYFDNEIDEDGINTSSDADYIIDDVNELNDMEIEGEYTERTLIDSRYPNVVVKGNLPKDVYVKVAKLSYEDVKEYITDSEKFEFAYDVTLYRDDDVYEAENEITVVFKRISNAEDINITHVKDWNTPEREETMISGETMKVELDSLSPIIATSPANGDKQSLVDSINALISSIPKYYQVYYTKSTADDVTDIVGQINNTDLNSKQADELETIKTSLDTAINNLTFRTSIVPQIFISTKDGNGNQIEKSTGYVETAISVVDEQGNTIDDASAKIKVRGNSTSGAEKKPFNIKLSSKQNLLGMGKAKKWCLLANCFDPTLMRNYIGLDLASKLGLEYTSENKYIELWIDGRYKGCYQLTEAVETGKTRVDIDVENDNDFLIEINCGRVENGVTYVTSKDGVRFEINEPEEPTPEQLSNIKNTIDSVADAIGSKDYDSVQSIIDVESFEKMYLLNEFMKTVDFGAFSVFYYFKGGKLYCGPAWDFDLSTGNANPGNYTTYYLAGDEYGYKGLWALGNPWINKLYKYDEFKSEVINCYQNNLQRFKDTYEKTIDDLIENYGEVFSRNYATYSTETPGAGWIVSKVYSGLELQPKSTYSDNVEYLRDWLSNRCDYLQQVYSGGSFTITWVNCDGSVLEIDSEVEYGSWPQYNSPTPTKIEDEQYTYTFAGWSPNVTSVVGDVVYIAQYVANSKYNYVPSRSSGSGGGGSSLSGVVPSGTMIIAGAKAAVTPLIKAANGVQTMGSSTIATPITMLPLATRATVLGAGGQASWTTVNGHYQLKDAAGNLIKNKKILVSDNLTKTSLGNVSCYAFDANGNMLLGWQWLQDTDGKWRQYYFNEENNALLGASLLGGTKDGKTLNADGQVVVNGVVQEHSTKPNV